MVDRTHARLLGNPTAGCKKNNCWVRPYFTQCWAVFNPLFFRVYRLTYIHAYIYIHTCTQTHTYIYRHTYIHEFLIYYLKTQWTPYRVNSPTFRIGCLFLKSLLLSHQPYFWNVHPPSFFNVVNSVVCFML